MEICNFSLRFSVYNVLSLEFEYLKHQKTWAVKNIFRQEKLNLSSLVSPKRISKKKPALKVNCNRKQERKES